MDQLIRLSKEELLDYSPEYSEIDEQCFQCNLELQCLQGDHRWKELQHKKSISHTERKGHDWSSRSMVFLIKLQVIKSFFETSYSEGNSRPSMSRSQDYQRRRQLQWISNWQRESQLDDKNGGTECFESKTWIRRQAALLCVCEETDEETGFFEARQVFWWRHCTHGRLWSSWLDVTPSVKGIREKKLLFSWRTFLQSGKALTFVAVDLRHHHDKHIKPLTWLSTLCRHLCRHKHATLSLFPANFNPFATKTTQLLPEFHVTSEWRIL